MSGWRVVETLLWLKRDQDDVELPDQVVAAALAAELSPNPFGRKEQPQFEQEAA